MISQQYHAVYTLISTLHFQRNPHAKMARTTAKISVMFPVEKNTVLVILDMR